MPELPEVETSRRGIAPHVVGETIQRVVIRDRRLRWPISAEVDDELTGSEVLSVDRRAKYLLINTNNGTAILHLGMSGSIRIVENRAPAGVHDHFDFELSSGNALRYRDPRRFGSLHWSDDPYAHPLLSRLGPEPLGSGFSGDYLWRKSRGRKIAVKQFVMDANVVVGVGNIYANEALFTARINPKRAAGRISRTRFTTLADAVRDVLQRAIRAGGTTLQDFVGGDGEAGYFSQELDVYGREGLPCRVCTRRIRAIVQGQRATFYCTRCQT